MTLLAGETVILRDTTPGLFAAVEIIDYAGWRRIYPLQNLPQKDGQYFIAHVNLEITGLYKRAPRQVVR